MQAMPVIVFNLSSNLRIEPENIFRYNKKMKRFHLYLALGIFY